MRTIWTLIRKDLLRRAKSPVGTLVLMAIPLAVTLLFGLVFSPSGKQSVPRFTLLLVDLDRSVASQFVKSSFSQGELARLIELREVEPAEGARLMADGKATALLEVPKGFGDDLLDGKAVTLRLLRNPSERFLPDVAQKVTETLALVLGYGSRALAEPLREIRSMDAGGAFPDEASWLAVARLFRDRLSKIGKYALPPVIELVAEDVQPEGPPAPAVNYFALFLPGMALMSLLFLAGNAVGDLGEESAGGQLRRIYTAPVHSVQILAGKLGFAFMLVFGAFVLMMALGVLAFGVQLQSPFLFLAGGACSSLACIGVMALVHSFLGKRQRSEAVSSVLIVVMCMLGGSFVPLDALPAFFQIPARFTLNYWAIDLLRSGVSTGLPAGPPWRSGLILLAIAISTLGLGAALLHRQLRQGVAA